jgi:hypothetical protein
MAAAGGACIYRIGPVDKIRRVINGLVAGLGTPRLTNHVKTLVGRALMGVPGELGAGRSIGRLQVPYSLAALTKAIRGATTAPLGVADASARLGVRLPTPRARAALFESTKSATRGTISARNRDPLNTP